MEAVFLKLLEMSFYGSLLILAILPVRVLLKKAPRWSICLLWALAAVALACPLRFESTASVMPTSVSQTTTIVTPALPLVQTEPVLIPDLTENPIQALTPAQTDWTAVGTGVWLIGMAAMLLWAGATYLRLRRRVAASIEIENNVCICDDIDTPFILGILHPRIYLPSAMDTALHGQVLLHERAHLKRRDHWWKPLGYLLLTLHWFNPPVWLAYGLLCRDIELACDEKVIRHMDTQHKKAYSEALLRCSMPRHLITACPLAFGEVGAKQRIKAVLHYKKPAFWVVVIAMIVCIALAVTFLTNPKLTTLGELSDYTAADIAAITVHKDLSTGRSVSNIETVCSLLSGTELRQRMGKPRLDTDWSTISIERKDHSAAYHLYFSPDRTRLWLLKQDSVTSIGQQGEGTYYEVLSPNNISQILYSEFLYEINDTDPLTPAAMERLIGEHLTENNRHYANLQLLHVTLNDQSHGMTYTMVSLDHLSHDGKVTAENALYLVGFTNGYVAGMASGEWGMSAGYYPNAADFNGNIVLWTTRSAAHLALNPDGTLNADAVVPNEFTSYRITCNDGSTYFWDCYGSGSMFVLPKGQKPVKIAPIDSKGNEVDAFAFTEEYLPVSKVNTTLKGGWDVFLEMNEENGKLEILTSYPTYADTNLYLNMDSSFTGHEPLYAALCNAPQSFPNLKLINEQSYKGYEYAVIQYDSSEGTVTALVEYTIDGSAVTLLTYAEGEVPDTQGFLTGYRMNCASMEGGTMYWSLYAQHYAITDNGTAVDHTRTLYPDFTHFQFTMRNLETQTFPAYSNFFLCELDSVVPPALVTPMEGGTMLTALSSEVPALSYNAYSFPRTSSS